jgi:hypothetical protein
MLFHVQAGAYVHLVGIECVATNVITVKSCVCPRCFIVGDTRWLQAVHNVHQLCRLRPALVSGDKGIELSCKSVWSIRISGAATAGVMLAFLVQDRWSSLFSALQSGNRTAFVAACTSAAAGLDPELRPYRVEAVLHRKDKQNTVRRFVCSCSQACCSSLLSCFHLQTPQPLGKVTAEFPGWGGAIFYAAAQQGLADGNLATIPLVSIATVTADETSSAITIATTDGVQWTLSGLDAAAFEATKDNVFSRAPPPPLAKVSAVPLTPSSS